MILMPLTARPWPAPPDSLPPAHCKRSLANADRAQHANTNRALRGNQVALTQVRQMNTQRITLGAEQHTSHNTHAKVGADL